MKFFIKILLVITVLLNTTKVYVDNNEDYYNNNIEKSVLLENYLISHKKNIEDFIEKYNINNDYDLQFNLDKIEYFISILDKIQEWKVTYENQNFAINTIVKSIKEINSTLKILLKEKKEYVEANVEKKLKAYYELGLKISEKLDDTNYILYKSNIYNKEILNDREKSIRDSIIKLNKISNVFKNFNRVKFNSEEEIKSSFTRLLKEIISETRKIKEY